MIPVSIRWVACAPQSRQEPNNGLLALVIAVRQPFRQRLRVDQHGRVDLVVALKEAPYRLRERRHLALVLQLPVGLGHGLRGDDTRPRRSTRKLQGRRGDGRTRQKRQTRSEEHTSEL